MEDILNSQYQIPNKFFLFLGKIFPLARLCYALEREARRCFERSCQVVIMRMMMTMIMMMIIIVKI